MACGKGEYMGWGKEGVTGHDWLAKPKLGIKVTAGRQIWHKPHRHVVYGHSQQSEGGGAPGTKGSICSVVVSHLAGDQARLAPPPRLALERLAGAGTLFNQPRWQSSLFPPPPPSPSGQGACRPTTCVPREAGHGSRPPWLICSGGRPGRFFFICLLLVCPSVCPYESLAADRLAFLSGGLFIRALCVAI